MELLAEKVITIIAGSQQIEPGTISVDSSFEDLGIDSLQGLNIIYDLETEFDIEIPNELALNIQTVQQLIDELNRFLSESQNDSPASEGAGPKP